MFIFLLYPDGIKLFGGKMSVDSVNGQRSIIMMKSYPRVALFLSIVTASPDGGASRGTCMPFVLVIKISCENNFPLIPLILSPGIFPFCDSHSVMDT